MSDAAQRDCDQFREEIAMLEQHHRHLLDKNTRLERRIKTLMESQRHFIGGVERVALEMEAPNEFTPRLIELCGTQRKELFRNGQ